MTVALRYVCEIKEVGHFWSHPELFAGGGRFLVDRTVPSDWRVFKLKAKVEVEAGKRGDL